MNAVKPILKDDVTPDLMPIDALVPSGINPRREQNSQADQELLDSVKQHGIVTPLLVRPSARPGTWEIVAGHRRHAAALEAGLTDVPVLIRELNDQEAREIALVENLQRRNLSPLDEAAGFKTLLDFAGTKHTPKSVAAAIGMPERYVWDRLKLLDLVPTAQQLLADGLITVAHAIKIAKLTRDQQDDVIAPEGGGLFTSEDGLFGDDELAMEEQGEYFARKAVSLRELDAWIATHVRFDAVQAAASDPLDFGPVAERVTEAIAKPGRGKKVVHITREYHVHPDAKDTERTFCHDAWKRADGYEGSEPCDDAVLGVVVVGPGYGDAFDVCVNKACDVHWRQERKAREKAAKQRTSDSGSASSRTAHNDYAAQEQRRKLEETAWKAIQSTVIAAIVKGTEQIQTTDEHLKFALANVTPYQPELLRAWKAAVPTVTIKTFGRAQVLGDALRGLYNADPAARICRKLKIKFDVEAAMNAATAELKAKTKKTDQPKAKKAGKR